MRNWLSFLLIILFPVSTWAQEMMVQGRVVDAETGEALPYVSIYVEEGKGTLSNDDGDFKLKVDEDNELTFSCIGYEQYKTSAHKTPAVIRLKPYSTIMKEVTIHSYDQKQTDNILQRTIDSLTQDYKNRSKWVRRYFFRTLTEMEGGNYITEAFMIAHSVVNLRSVLISSGLQGSDTEDGGTLNMAYNNIHQLVEVAPMTKESSAWSQAIKPLSDFVTLHKYYNILIQQMQGEDGRTLYRIEFDWKNNLPIELKYKRNITGTAYVDAETCRLLRFDGSCNNYSMSTSLGMWASSYATTIKFQLEYDYSQGAASVSHLVIHGDNEKSVYHVLLLAMSKEEKQIDYIMGSGSNIVTAIRGAGYDAKLWDKYDIVKRTREEERAAFGRVNSPPKANEFATVDAERTDNSALSTLWQRLWMFSKRYAQEKIFVHMDNTSYWLGDTLWFAAYMRDTDDKMPSLKSNVLYVELLNQEGFLVERKQIEMAEGYGWGYFALNNPGQYAGFYELRAYTRWQLNWGVHERKHPANLSSHFVNEEKEKAFFRDYDKLYSRVFPVYDRLTEKDSEKRVMTLRPLMGEMEKQSKRQLDVQVYPEGGHLIAGMETYIAFEATWNDGEWAEGELHFGNKTTQTTNRGRGRLLIKPDVDMREPLTFVAKDGTKATVTLPVPSKRGVTIHAEEKADAWDIIIKTTVDLTPQNLGLSVMNEGKISYFRQLKDYSQEFHIPISSLQPGVNQATVFDDKGHILADRLFFVWKEKTMQPTLKIEGLRDNYKPYEVIELHISRAMGDSTAYKCPHYFSLAVRDGERMERTYDNANILTEMLLASEIRGYVPDAEWYFQKNDSAHHDALDLMLMVQGWRRFSWEEMATNEKWAPSQPKENAITLVGNVYDIPQNRQDDEDDSDGSWVLHTEAMHPTLKTSNHMYNYLQEDGRFSIPLPSYPFSSCRDYLIFMDVLKKESEYFIAETKNRNPDEFRNKTSFLIPKVATKQKKPMDLEKTDVPKYTVRLDKPFPRFAQPYNYYQQHLPKGPVILNQLSQTEFRDDCHILMMDAGEVAYGLDDAGLTLGDGFDIRDAVAVLSLGAFNNDITIRRGINRFRRKSKKMQHISSGSIYAPQYLRSYPFTSDINENKVMECGSEGNVENYVLYTNVNLRDITSSQTNLLTIVEYPYPDGIMRAMPGSRTFYTSGFSKYVEFYHPNYRYKSKGKKDDRRTLFWAPCLMLNNKGETHIMFFNNSRTTHLNVEAEGQATDGTLLWSKKE